MPQGNAETLYREYERLCLENARLRTELARSQEALGATSRVISGYFTWQNTLLRLESVTSAEKLILIALYQRAIHGMNSATPIPLEALASAVGLSAATAGRTLKRLVNLRVIVKRRLPGASGRGTTAVMIADLAYTPERIAAPKTYAGQRRKG